MAGESKIPQSSECIVRVARNFEEVNNLVGPLMPALGWDLADADCATYYHVSTPSAWFVVCAKDHPDRAEGCVVSFVYENKVGWLAYFMLNEAMRGQGWGGKVFQAGLDYLASKNLEFIGLDAVQEQVGTYGRRGFVENGRLRVMTREDMNKKPLKDGLEHTRPGEEMIGLEHMPHRILVQSDLEHTGLQREQVWTREALFNRDDVQGFALVKEGTKEELEGWIMVRNSQLGWRFGPLYATSEDRAELLLRTAMQRLEGEKGTFIAEVWPQNPQAVKVFESLGWTFEGVTNYRMWLHGKVPKPQQAGELAEQQMFAVFD